MNNNGGNKHSHLPINISEVAPLKRDNASADRVIPADISEELSENIRALSKQIFDFQATGVARIDYLVQKDTQKVYFNEINTIRIFFLLFMGVF